MTGPRNLMIHPVHLGRAGTVIGQPEFTGMDWYDAYAARTAGDGAEGRLVSMYRFTRSWDSWERHPAGDELVLCLSGAMTLIQAGADGALAETRLGPGDYAINPPNVWHTADVEEEASALFITTGLGTEHRPR